MCSLLPIIITLVSFTALPSRFACSFNPHGTLAWKCWIIPGIAGRAYFTHHRRRLVFCKPCPTSQTWGMGSGPAFCVQFDGNSAVPAICTFASPCNRLEFDGCRTFPVPGRPPRLDWILAFICCWIWLLVLATLGCPIMLVRYC